MSEFPTTKAPTTRKTKVVKPVLVQVGGHLIDVNDVACISSVQKGKLFVVRLKSQPNMEYPVWVKKHEIAALLEHFEIKVSDIPESDD